MAVQILRLGREDYVIVRKRDFDRLRQAAGEDAHDAAVIRRRLAEMKKRGERPIPWSKAKAMLKA